MLAISFGILLSLLASGCVQGAAIVGQSAASTATLQPRDEIPHDSVEPIPQAIRFGPARKLIKQYQPFLKVVDGCVPFPAVDVDGNTSGGLNPSGRTSGDCSSSKGQVYVRTTICGGRRAIMYAWYMPKDQAQPFATIGHRHDWESAVVWLNSKTDAYIGMAASGHGSFVTTTDAEKNFSKGRPLIRYDNPITIKGVDHRMLFTTEVGGMQPMIDWARMKGRVQRALADTDFGSAIVPFRPGRFEQQLGKAWIGGDFPGQC